MTGLSHCFVMSDLLNIICRVQKFNQYFVVWHEKQKLDHPHDVITYTTIIFGLAKFGVIVEACDLFEKLKSRGRKPILLIITTYNWVELCRQSDGRI